MAQANAKFRTGVVFGKFYPLTRGHQFLIETALSQSERLTICVSHRPSETIPVAVRGGWIRELYPTTKVVTLDDSLPYFPEECSTPHEFYRIWERVVIDACGQRPDACFTSEPAYDPYVSGYLRAAHVIVDADRATVPISATKVRTDPFACWEYLDPVVRSYFVKTVCLYGPESTGKTTLSQKLAEHYETTWQPEFAREFLGERHCVYQDMQPIADGHFAAREQYKRQANRVLFVDTDTLTTKVFSNHYYGNCPQRVTELISHPANQNDLYLLTSIDVPWVPETSRDLGTPELRAKMQRDLLAALQGRGRPYVMISGSDWEDRFRQAVAAVERHIFKRA
jgi:HTH-type transcriptional regulator, transcriptional repressor of NAD biosynthesis genes